MYTQHPIKYYANLFPVFVGRKQRNRFYHQARAVLRDEHKARRIIVAQVVKGMYASPKRILTPISDVIYFIFSFAWQREYKLHHFRF